MADSGFLIINKPSGITSFGVISRLRKITGEKRIGHAGTLDPLATGVLICAVGRDATKRIDEFQKLEKKYRATVRLGATSDTDDAEGVITETPNVEPIAESTIKEALAGLVGTYEQQPPIFSAKKIQGVAAYTHARKGIAVTLKPSLITIHSIDIVSFNWPQLIIDVHCGKGTYIRSLARDLGQKLGCGGMLTGLERTAIGEFTLDKSITLENLTVDSWKNRLIQNI